MSHCRCVHVCVAPGHLRQSRVVGCVFPLCLAHGLKSGQKMYLARNKPVGGWRRTTQVWTSVCFSSCGSLWGVLTTSSFALSQPHPALPALKIIAIIRSRRTHACLFLPSLRSNILLWMILVEKLIWPHSLDYNSSFFPTWCHSRVKLRLVSPSRNVRNSPGW